MTLQLKQDFAVAIRRQLDRYPVWEPGGPLALGDYGILRDRTLHKLGNIGTFGFTFVESVGSETPYQFASEGTRLLGIRARGEIEPAAQAASIEASAEIHFNHAHGIFISALRSRVTEIRELRELALKIRESGKWNYAWKLVTEMRTVNPGTIIMGSSAGTTLLVEGASDLLEQFQIGGLTIGTKLRFTGEAALQVVGVEGPVFFDLCYFPRFFSDDIKRAAAPVDDLPAEPYMRWPAHLGVRDDD